MELSIDVMSINMMLLIVLLNQVALGFDVFGSLVIVRILNQLDCALIVTKSNIGVG